MHFKGMSGHQIYPEVSILTLKVGYTSFAIARYCWNVSSEVPAFNIEISICMNYNIQGGLIYICKAQSTCEIMIAPTFMLVKIESVYQPCA